MTVRTIAQDLGLVPSIHASGSQPQTTPPPLGFDTYAGVCTYMWANARTRARAHARSPTHTHTIDLKIRANTYQKYIHLYTYKFLPIDTIII